MQNCRSAWAESAIAARLYKTCATRFPQHAKSLPNPRRLLSFRAPRRPAAAWFARQRPSRPASRSKLRELQAPGFAGSVICSRPPGRLVICSREITDSEVSRAGSPALIRISCHAAARPPGKGGWRAPCAEERRLAAASVGEHGQERFSRVARREAQGALYLVPTRVPRGQHSLTIRARIELLLPG